MFLCIQVGCLFLVMYFYRIGLCFTKIKKLCEQCVVVVPTDEDYKTRCKKQEEDGEKNIPEEAVNEMKGDKIDMIDTSTFS